MAKLTCSTKEWDKVRPKSVTKTGVSAAIKAALKAVPGGTSGKLKNDKQCVAALTALAKLLIVASKAQSTVKSAKDDTKGAARKLKQWVDETKAVRDDVARLQRALGPAAAEPVAKSGIAACAPTLKKLEGEVQSVLAGFKKVEGNQGQAEGLIKEATIEMIRVAGTLQESGWVGSKPADFMKDSSFATAHKFWREQVEKWVKAAKLTESLEKQAMSICPAIDKLKKASDATVSKLGKDIDLDIDPCRSFRALSRQIDEFYAMTRTDKSRGSYQAFRFFPTATPSGQIAKEQEKLLESSFKSMKKVDAESYLDQQMAKYGFDRKQMKKAIATATKVSKAVGTLSKAYAGLPPAKQSQALNKLRQLRDELVVIDEKYQRGRKDQQLANQLGAAVNADYKKTVEKAMVMFSTAAADAQKAVAAVEKA